MVRKPFLAAQQMTAVTPARLAQIVFIFFLPITVICTAGLAQMPYPKPQIATAEGKAAPDFTLKDQSGTRFHLADQRGSRLLLVFYRGHW